MDTAKTRKFVAKMWEDSIIPKLMEYIRIPNKSPLYDPQWQERGHYGQGGFLNRNNGAASSRSAA